MHPIDIPHVRPAQQATVSSGENTVVASPVAIQLRSLKASVLPKAQHEPQLDWSLTRPVICAQAGHAVRTSKESGIASSGVLNKVFSRGGS